ncbi:2-isopropylmalate synthase [[Eubacterium] cellulosolvens]
MNIEPSAHIRMLDTTLRDGEQTPGVSLTPEEKLAIARQLARLGVDAIEAGFPISSEGEAEGVKLIAKEGLSTEVYALARASPQDIDAALRCDVSHVHVFIATSDLHLQHKLRLSREQALEKAMQAVSYAKQHGLVVEFSAEDATRSDLEYLGRVFRSVCDAGVDRVNIPDTVGVTSPAMMRHIVDSVKQAVDRPISVHCHDDFGLAVANSLAGIEAGAIQAHVTVNGIGERAGNASLEELVMALHQLAGKRTRIDTTLLYETSRLVAKITGVFVQPNKAVVGENAFGHESGIHTHGVSAQASTYEPFDPALVGRKRWFQAGKHAGAHGIAAQLAELGLSPSPRELDQIVSKVKDLADGGKTVTDTDLFAIAENVISTFSAGSNPISLVDFAVMTGIGVVPTASVRININGTQYVSSETGVGPVDSAMKAVQKLTDPLVHVRLKEYRLEAITGGSDALAEVLVKVQDDEGNTVSARTTGEDVVRASVEAMILGMNKLLLKKKITAKNPPEQETPLA